MRTGSINKTLVGGLALVLMFSSIFIYQPTSASKTETTIRGIVQDMAGEPVENASVVLYDLHTNLSTSATTNVGGIYEIKSVSPGHYGLLATKKGYLDNNTHSTIFITEGTTQKLNINLGKIGTFFTLSGSVTNISDALPVANATVTLILKDNIYKIYGINGSGYFSTTTNQTGYYEFPDTFGGTFSFKVTAPGFFTNSSMIDIAANTSLNVSLNKTVSQYAVRGYIYHDEEPVTNNFAFLYDKNKGRIVSNNSTGSSFYFSIPAYPGEFLLIVESGYKRFFTDVNITTASITSNINVETYVFEERTTNIDFADWLNVYVNESRKLTPNSLIERLTNINNPRLQVDLDFGDGNGYLNDTEVKSFTDSLNATGSKYNESKRLFMVNGVSYALVDYFVILQNAVGPVSSNESMYLNTTMKFNTSAINTSQNEYNFTKSIISQVSFPETYESRISNIDTVTGYNISIGVNTPPTIVNFSVPEVVASNVNVTFIDMGSSDAVTTYSTLNFTWIFNDTYSNATNQDIEYKSTTTHVFTVPGYYNVTLIVNDTAGGTNSTIKQVLVDGTIPTSACSTTIENQTVRFNATDSQDNDMFDGGIKYYNWFFNDNYSGQNYYNGTDLLMNHTYTYPGLYNATLTVIDKAGNKNTSVLALDVPDKTPPVGKILVNNKTGEVVNIAEGENLTFAAEAFDEYYANDVLSNATSDKNASILRIAYYNWSFGDDKYDNGTDRTVTHTYDKGAIDEYHPTISVIVTDASGNNATINLTAPLVEISPKNISKITVLDGSLKLSDDAPTESQLITINATVSNVGRVYAENIVVDFYVDTTKIGTQTISNLSAKDTANNTLVATIDWVVNVKPGKHIIKAVVVDPNNASKYTVYSGEQNRTLNVMQQEIPRDFYIYSGIIIFLVIIIGVYVLNKKKRDKLTIEDDDRDKKRIDSRKKQMQPIKKK